MNTILSLISENWFLSEPAFYSLYCLQQVEENVRMECTFRCGIGKIQYNPLMLDKLNYKQAEQQLRIEMIRLFLGHPYQRQPQGCCNQAKSLGSDCTIADGYCMLHEKFPLQGPDIYHLPMGETFEFYAKEIQKQSERDDKEDENQNHNDNENLNTGNSKLGSNAIQQRPADHAQLWQEDALRTIQIHQLIERTKDWGSIPGDMVSIIEASTRARLNPNLVMQGFRAAILSQQRQLTRMRPNRRTQFLQMGSSRQFNTRLLIAVDVSSSVTDEMLSDFYSSILNLFKYGIAEIDTVQFDAELGEVTSLAVASRNIKVSGRGGTDFQPVIDFVTKNKKGNKFDGLIIYTDGQATPPSVPPYHLPILWVTPKESDWLTHHVWMDLSGRSCWLNA